jgi:hypothetical protein
MALPFSPSGYIPSYHHAHTKTLLHAPLHTLTLHLHAAISLVTKVYPRKTRPSFPLIPTPSKHRRHSCVHGSGDGIPSRDHLAETSRADWVRGVMHDSILTDCICFRSMHREGGGRRRAGHFADRVSEGGLARKPASCVEWA